MNTMSVSTLQDARDKAAAFEYDEAVKLYREYLKENESDADVWSELGEVLLKQENLTESADAYAAAYDLNSNDNNHVYRFGKALERLHEYDQAKALFEKASELSDGLKSKIKVGDILAKTGKFDEALVLFTLLASLYPDNATIQHRMAGIYEALHRPADALQALKKEVELREKALLSSASGKSWYLLGETRAHLQQWEEATAAYRKSFEIQPLPDTRFRLGNALIKSGNVEEGKAELFKAVEENGKDLQFLLKIGDAFTDLAMYDDAITVYTRALEVRNVRADTWAAIAYALLKLEKKEEARAFFEMAKASAAVREMPWADKLHKSEKTEYLDKELAN